MTFWPAASKFWIADQCQLPWSPRRPPWPKRAYEPNDSARMGTAFHEMSDATVKIMTNEDGSIKHPGIIASTLEVAPYAERNKLTESAALKVAAMHRHFIEDLNMYLNENRYSAMWAEQAVVFDLYKDTARLADTKDESYKAPPGCISSIQDFVAIRDNALVVRDYKTGWGAIEAPPEKNWQLRFGGLCSARLHGATTVRIELVEFHEERKPFVQVARFDDDMTYMDAFELEVVLADVRGLMHRLSGAVEPNPGPACARCPVVQTCPTTIDTLSRIKEAGQATEPFWTTGIIESPEQATSIHRRLDMLEKAVKRYREQMTWYAKEVGGFKTDEDHFYGPVEQQGDRKIDVRTNKQAREILKRHIKPEYMYLAIDERTSFEGLKRAISAQGGEPGEGKSSDYGKLIAELTEANAIVRESSYVRVSEYRIKKPKEKKDDRQGGLFGDGEEK